jgi:hypothetical protein
MCPSIRERITDERLQAATVVGLVTIPLTVIFSVGPVSSTTAEITGVPFLVGCLLVGYAYSDRAATVALAGRRAGFVGSLGPIIAGLYEAYPVFWTAAEHWAVPAVLTGVVIVMSVALFGIVGALLALVGEWAGESLASRGFVSSNS